MIHPIINPLVEEFERRSVRLAPGEEAEIRHLLSKYEPVLRFQRRERFFPVSAMLYLLFSTIWYIPMQSREGEDIKDDPFQKRARPRRFELWLNRPHIQLNTEVEQDSFASAPAQDQYVQVQHALGELDRSGFAAADAVQQARRVLENRMRRFRAAWLNPGMLFLHFSETIPPWDRRLLRHWFLPRGSDEAASRKYDQLTLADGKREICYYGRVVDQCGYRVVQYWFFYAFNDYRSAVRGTNNHEGDWERICIFLTQEGGEWQPSYATFSAHNSQQTLAWKDVQCVDAARQHPVVYVARGSHACYFTPGVHRPGVGPLRVRDFALGDGEEVGGGVWSTPRVFSETDPDWLFFDGFWGAYIRDLLMRENAPRGPLYTIEPGFHRPVPRPSWYHPVSWAGLDCVGGEACDHELRGYYGYGAPDSAWQAEWGTDEEWEAWATSLAH
jgi:hypothetical protein